MQTLAFMLPGTMYFSINCITFSSFSWSFLSSVLPHSVYLNKSKSFQTVYLSHIHYMYYMQCMADSGIDDRGASDCVVCRMSVNVDFCMTNFKTILSS